MVLGSTVAIEAAKENISVAWEKLDELIVKTESSDASMINSFASDWEKLFSIIGENAGNFAERRQEIESQLEELYEKRNAKLEEYEQFKGITKKI